MSATMVTIDQVDTYVIDVGSGPTIVLLHGAAFGVDAETTWFRTIEGLRDRFRVVAFDQVGFGRTDMPADGIYKNRLERCDHAASVLSYLGLEKSCLVGHSEGAFMAARLAITNPELARSLVLVTTGGTAPYLGGRADDGWIAACEAAYNDTSKLESEDAFIAANGHLSRHEDPELEALLRASYRRGIAAGQEQLFANLPAAEADYERYGDLQNDFVLPHIGDLNLPTLLLWAADDATAPVARAEKLLALLRRGSLVVIEGAAHNVMLDQPDQFNAQLADFAS